ncbi:MAG TPA: FAD-dependent oxidoreductase [Burkholderiaceae bacterium]|nr:FAD-dependent oxidoreductase [Burkholderiaceae bacterium]
MSIYESRLQGREEVATRTLAFHLRKPAGFAFEPGQAIDLVLPGATPAESQDARHTFSIVSAPFETELVVATRMRDSVFKRTLKGLPIGSPLALEGPFGSLTLHRDRGRPAVLIAGGIGITPFISMLRQAAHERWPQRLLLLYSNRRPEDAAFLDELQELDRRSEAFRLVATMTQAGDIRVPWEGRTGPIDARLIGDVVAGLPAPVYYVAGPPGLVESICDSLSDAGIDGDDVRSEDFFGY